jgi:hypothetical protein
MMTQDPWDEMVDMYSALNTHVAKVACKENIGTRRHTTLKIDQTYNALRILTSIDANLFVEV